MICMSVTMRAGTVTDTVAAFDDSEGDDADDDDEDDDDDEADVDGAAATWEVFQHIRVTEVGEQDREKPAAVLDDVANGAMMVGKMATSPISRRWLLLLKEGSEETSLDDDGDGSRGCGCGGSVCKLARAIDCSC